MKTKELLSSWEMEFDQVNAEKNQPALDELKRLGARGIPTVALGENGLYMAGSRQIWGRSWGYLIGKTRSSIPRHLHNGLTGFLLPLSGPFVRCQMNSLR